MQQNASWEHPAAGVLPGCVWITAPRVVATLLTHMPHCAMRSHSFRFSHPCADENSCLCLCEHHLSLIMPHWSPDVLAGEQGEETAQADEATGGGGGGKKSKKNAKKAAKKAAAVATAAAGSALAEAEDDGPEEPGGRSKRM